MRRSFRDWVFETYLPPADPEARRCKHCGHSNVYISCYKCVDWKEKLQEKPGFK